MEKETEMHGMEKKKMDVEKQYGLQDRGIKIKFYVE